MNKIKEILGIFKLKCKYAHLVSLIVLLILAGVSLSSVFSEKGIFSRTEEKGDLTGATTSQSRDSYPDNNKQGNIWYVYAGIN